MYNECYKELKERIYKYNINNKKEFTILLAKRGEKVLTPTKNLHEDKSILKIGARILSFLTSPSTINSIWNKYLDFQNKESSSITRIQFDTFILAIDFLYIIGAIEYQDDLLWRAKND